MLDWRVMAKDGGIPSTLVVSLRGLVQGQRREPGPVIEHLLGVEPSKDDIWDFMGLLERLADREKDVALRLMVLLNYAAAQRNLGWHGFHDRIEAWLLQEGDGRFFRWLAWWCSLDPSREETPGQFAAHALSRLEDHA